MRVCGLVGFICALILLTGDTVSAQDLKFFEGHAVKSNGTGAKKLKFTDTDAANTEEFVDICRSMCEDGDADGKNGSCGGFVVNYTNRTKSTPKYCVFKKEGSQPYRKSSKDTYMLSKYELQLTFHIMRDIEMTVGGVAMTTDHITPSVVADEIMPEINRMWKQAGIHWNLEEVILENVTKENFVGVPEGYPRNGGIFFEGHAVSGNSVAMPNLDFTDTEAQNFEEFVNFCKSTCEEADAEGENGMCGGFVVNYTDGTKSTPDRCVFKSAGSEPYPRPSKDTYMLAGNTYDELRSIVENATRDADGRSDPRRLIPLFLFMDPENRIERDEFGTNNFHVYIYPFIGNTSQGNAMRSSDGRSFGFHTVIGAWTNKHNSGGAPEVALIKEEWNEWDRINRGSLSRTIGHEVGHVLGLNHNDCAGNCMMGPTHGYLLTEAQITTAQEHAAMRINDSCEPLSACGYSGNIDIFFGD